MAFAKLAYSAALASLLAAGATDTALAQSATGFSNVNASEAADFSLSGTDFDISGSANADASASANVDTAGSANVDASGSVQVAQQTYVDVIANLEAAGYTVVETKRTLLGRIRIVASNSEHLRQVIVSRATGEVKSDEIVEIFAETADGATGLGGNAAVNATGSAGLSLGTGSLGTGLGAGGSVSVGGSTTGGSGDGSATGGLGGSVSGGVSGSVSGTVGGLLGN